MDIKKQMKTEAVKRNGRLKDQKENMYMQMFICLIKKN